MHPPDLLVDPFHEQQALQQLIELGYVAAPEGDSEAARIKPATREANYNKAMAFVDSRQFKRAIEVLEGMERDEPGEARVIMALAQCHLMLRQLPQARSYLNAVSPAGLLGAQHGLLLGILEFVEGNREKSLEILLRAEKADPRLPLLHVQLGNVYLRQRRWEDAERAFAKALTIDGDSAGAHYGVGLVAFHRDQYEAAIECFLRAVGLLHHFPRAHLSLGMALARLGWHDRAVRALEIALTQSPHLPVAHRLLAVCYGQLGQPDRAMLHRRRAQQQSEQEQAVREAAAGAP